MNAFIPMYVYTTNFVSTRVEAIKDHYKDRDRGASLVEYAGLIALAVVILGALYWAFTQTDFSNTVRDRINDILGGKGNNKPLNKG